MPKIIETMCNVLPEEGILVRSSYLRNNVKASELVDEARRRTKDLVCAAQEEAECMREKARAEGHAAGILQAINEVLVYLAGYEDLARQLQTRLHERVRSVLSACVSDPEVVIAALQECLDAAGVCEDDRAELVLPEYFRPHHHRVMARLSPHLKSAANIEYQGNDRFLLRVGKEVAEFVHDDFVGSATRRLMSELPSTYLRGKELADAANQRLRDLFFFESSCQDDEVGMESS